MKRDWWYGLYAPQCLSGRNAQARTWRRCVIGENVKKWRLLFEDGVTNLHEEQRSGRRFFVTKILKDTKNAEPGQSRRFTISELHERFSSCVSLSELGSCYRISHPRNTNGFTAVNSEPTPRHTDKSILFVARRCAKKRRPPDTRIPQILQVAKFENSSIEPRPCIK